MLHAAVTGTPLNADQEKLRGLLKPVTNKMSLLRQEVAKATDEQRKTVEFWKPINKQQSDLEAEQNVIRKQFIQSNPGSLVSLDALKASAGMVPNYAEVSSIFEGVISGGKNPVKLVGTMPQRWLRSKLLPSDH